jgi:hypothetical protein
MPTDLTVFSLLLLAAAGACTVGRDALLTEASGM